MRPGSYSPVPVGRSIPTVFDAIKQAFPDSEIIQCDGCGISGEDFEFALSDQNHLKDIKAEKIAENIEKAVSAARECDLVIFCGGDDNITSGEGRDRCELSLCGRQSELIERLHETGKPLVFVMIHGKPLSIERESEVSNAVVSCWFCGEFGAQAICDVLSGRVNPGGKLPFSLPRRSSMIPCYYSMLPGASNKYYEGKGDALYPFGHGLSYTDFEYSGLELNVIGKNTVSVKLKVKNTGNVTGDECVQIYVTDCESTVVTPKLLLKDFKRITLEPGEERGLEFTLGEKAFMLLNQKYEWVVEPGTFRISAASSSSDIRQSGEVTL